MKFMPCGSSGLEQALSLALGVLEICEKNTWKSLSTDNIVSVKRQDMIAQLDNASLDWDLLDYYWEPISHIDRGSGVSVGVCNECGWWQQIRGVKDAQCSSPFGCSGRSYVPSPARLMQI